MLVSLLESTQSVMVWKPMAVYGIGSTPRYVKTQEANWGLHGPLLPYTNKRYVPTFSDDARLG
jgi:hypothetical protein